MVNITSIYLAVANNHNIEYEPLDCLSQHDKQHCPYDFYADNHDEARSSTGGRPPHPFDDFPYRHVFELAYSDGIFEDEFPPTSSAPPPFRGITAFVQRSRNNPTSLLKPNPTPIWRYFDMMRYALNTYLIYQEVPDVVTFSWVTININEMLDLIVFRNLDDHITPKMINGSRVLIASEKALSVAEHYKMGQFPFVLHGTPGGWSSAIRRMKCLICRFINFAAAVDSDKFYQGNFRENIRYNNRLRQCTWGEFSCGWISGGEFSDLLEESDSTTDYSGVSSNMDDSNDSDMDDSNDSDMDDTKGEDDSEYDISSVEY